MFVVLTYVRDNLTKGPFCEGNEGVWLHGRCASATSTSPWAGLVCPKTNALRVPGVVECGADLYDGHTQRDVYMIPNRALLTFSKGGGCLMLSARVVLGVSSKTPSLTAKARRSGLVNRSSRNVCLFQHISVEGGVPEFTGK